jgi:hypothetical protein
VPPSALFAGALVSSTELVQLQPSMPASWWTGVCGAGVGFPLWRGDIAFEEETAMETRRRFDQEFREARRGPDRPGDRKADRAGGPGAGMRYGFLKIDP